MMHLYTASSPNGRKVQIALEELALDYRETWVDVRGGEQHEAWFAELCPNRKIPVLRDGDQTVWESGAILLYLADAHDPDERVLSKAPRARWEAIQYAFFQAAGLGPNLGRLADQLRKPEADRNAEMVDTFHGEVERLIGVMDSVLEDGRPFLAGEYSIADIMHYPWLQPVHALGAEALMKRPRVVAWVERVAGRPAVERVYRS